MQCSLGAGLSSSSGHKGIQGEFDAFSGRLCVWGDDSGGETQADAGSLCWCAVQLPGCMQR